MPSIGTSVETVVSEILPLNFETEVALAPSAAKEETQKKKKFRRTLSHCCFKKGLQQDLCKPQIPTSLHTNTKNKIPVISEHYQALLQISFPETAYFSILLNWVFICTASTYLSPIFAPRINYAYSQQV